MGIQRADVSNYLKARNLQGGLQKTDAARMDVL